MKPLKCLIADDEPIARQILERYIDDLPYLHLVGSCKDSFEVISMLETKSIDLVFLDINMPKLSGLSLLKTLEERPNVIITTAYKDYALEGFDLDVTDYLLKPFSFERFVQAVNKVKKSGFEETNVQWENHADSKYIFVKNDKKLIKLTVAEIEHVEAFGNFIKVYVGDWILSAETLTTFAERLSIDFRRIHKSFVINLAKLKFVEGNQVVMESGIKLPIGKSYRKDLLSILKEK